MSVINVHSHNLRGSLKSSADLIVHMLASKSCECTAILLQDVGLTGPDGPAVLQKGLEEKQHSIFANSSKNNKSRSVVIIVHESWQIENVFRDPSGSLIGVAISKATSKFSLYLPTSLQI